MFDIFVCSKCFEIMMFFTEFSEARRQTGKSFMSFVWDPVRNVGGAHCAPNFKKLEIIFILACSYVCACVPSDVLR